MIGRSWLWLAVLLLTAACALRIEIRIPQPRVPTERFVSNVGSATLPGGGANNCTAEATPCTMVRATAVAVCGDTITMLDGTYQGRNYVIDTYWDPPGNPTCSAGSHMLVRAKNDGGVVLDGQFARMGLQAANLTYWDFTGFDVINGSDDLVNYGATAVLYQSDHVTVKRVCASNTFPRIPAANVHTFPMISTSNSLLEDVCIFGTGRNMTNDFSVAFPNQNNVVRRLWCRDEGFPIDANGNGMENQCYQAKYTGDTSGPVRLINGIFINNPEQYISAWGTAKPQNPSAVFADRQSMSGGGGFSIYGLVIYGYDANPLTGAPYTTPGQTRWVDNTVYDSWGAWFMARYPRLSAVDVFLDSRSQNAITFQLYCDNKFGGSCATTETFDRLTAWTRPSAGRVLAGTCCGAGGPDNRASINGAVTGAPVTVTNGPHENDTFANLPNFYTGDGPGGILGARNCFEYTGGYTAGGESATVSLSSTKLWPWRMDDRIKAALARNRAAGRGGSALAGGAGSGYQAATVTSEIASRYGPIPAACNRSGAAFVPDFPVVTDFPTTPFLDQFNRADGAIGANYTATSGPAFTVAGNVAAAPATFSRMLWTADAFSGAHEVYATWPTAPMCCGARTLLTFAGTGSSDNSQWRVYVSRTAGANATLDIRRIDAAGASTTILGPINLGTDIPDNTLFGVRVSALQTIALYWKYTDGNTYRIGTVIDTNLPSANTRIGFAGITTETVENFGGGTCCGGAVNPANIGRFGSLIPKQ